MGNSIVGQLKFNALPPDIKKLSSAEIARFEQARQQMEKAFPGESPDYVDSLARNYIGVGERAPGGDVTASDSQVGSQFVGNVDADLHTDDGAVFGLNGRIDSLDETLIEGMARVDAAAGRISDTYEGDGGSFGAMPETALDPTSNAVDEMGQPLNGRSNYNALSKLGSIWSSDEPFMDKVFQTGAWSVYTVPDAEQRAAETMTRFGMTPSSQWARLDQIAASPLGGAAYGIASLFGASDKVLDLVLNVGVAADGFLMAGAAAKGRAPAFTGTQSTIEEAGVWNKPFGMRLPKNGEWTGTPGNSPLLSFSAEANAITGGKPIPFVNGWPRFGAWAIEEYPFANLTGTNKDFKLFHQQFAKDYKFNSATAVRDYFRQQDWRIHHVEDGRTLQLLPAALHENVQHTGGASLLRNAAVPQQTYQRK